MGYPGGIYGKGMHSFIIDELELGTRAATAIDYETVDPLGWYYDIRYQQEMTSPGRLVD